MVLVLLKSLLSAVLASLPISLLFFLGSFSTLLALVPFSFDPFSFVLEISSVFPTSFDILLSSSFSAPFNSFSPSSSSDSFIFLFLTCSTLSLLCLFLFCATFSSPNLRWSSLFTSSSSVVPFILLTFSSLMLLLLTFIVSSSNGASSVFSTTTSFSLQLLVRFIPLFTKLAFSISISFAILSFSVPFAMEFRVSCLFKAIVVSKLALFTSVSNALSSLLEVLLISITVSFALTCLSSVALTLLLKLVSIVSLVLTSLCSNANRSIVPSSLLTLRQCFDSPSLTWSTLRTRVFDDFISLSNSLLTLKGGSIQWLVITLTSLHL
uniref:Uncharacterized protein n=1 Tax=Cacopsylla melanoneura TaxID=428564 RepID=A0A8D9E308_9HEMI